MKVKIFEIETETESNSRILKVKNGDPALPTITDGWRFNFRKNSKPLGNETYVLTRENTPNKVEGCLIINHQVGQSYMAFIEVAPHNRGPKKKFDWVAGCLIAFACRLSFMNENEGYLAFDVIEDNDDQAQKLMQVYSQKYGAVRLGGTTTMIILPEGSELLIEEYLEK
jgi:hypothetical protein